MGTNEKLRGIFYIAGIIMFVCFALLAARGYIMIERVEIETISAIDNLENEATITMNETKQEAVNSIGRMETNATDLIDNVSSLINEASDMLARTETKIDKTTDESSTTMQSIQKTVGSMGKEAMGPISRIETDTMGLIRDAEETIQNIDSAIGDISKTTDDMKVAAKKIGDAADKIEGLLP